MNTLRHGLAAGLLAALAAGSSAFTAETRLTFIDPAAPEAAAIRQAGEAASAIIATRLVTELTAALGAGGPEKAVDVCHTKALPLTNAPLPAQPQVVAVKRSSLRLRNPANAPDAAERAALDHVAALIAGGRPAPAVLVQKIETAGIAAPEWRLYRSIGVQAACLTCHGSPTDQTPALRALLQERYPADAATGYAVGDWRGLIRVTVHQP
ncbi:MAG: DUF3365 domain-containing protein [Lacunisphaera sp.]|nr:DUF3365 domain-containing protein [Lacunisphaera sp.]